MTMGARSFVKQEQKNKIYRLNTELFQKYANIVK